MVLIPKGNEDFRGFGLVDMLWKVLLGVINWHIGEVRKLAILSGGGDMRGMATHSKLGSGGVDSPYSISVLWATERV